MFSPFAGGTIEKIQGLKIHIPPVGFVPDYYSWNGEIISTEILFSDRPKEEQHWRRPGHHNDLPFDLKSYNAARASEIKMQKANPDFKDEKLSIIKKIEWQRRLNGVWFMNNGTPTYLPGIAYFYLMHWRIDIGAPEYRITDREFWLFWQYIVEDPDSLGILEATLRRGGKSWKAGCIDYEYTSRTKNAQAGIQSKTDDDARKSVYAKIMYSFKNLPDFFKPIFDEDKGANPKGELSFAKTIRKGDNVSDFFDTELNSVIDYRAASPMAYDGSKLHRYIADECGKLEKHDVYERHGIVKFCCQVGSDIIGKCVYTTTVEDKDKGGAGFEVLWNASDPAKKVANNRTESGLYKFFMPADRAMNFDVYGYPDTKRNLKELLAKRKSYENNPKELAAYIRKEPLNENELFMTDSQKCPFNVMELTKVKEYCMNLTGDDVEDLEIQGDFIWDIVDEKAMFVPNEMSGKWFVNFLHIEAQQNRVSRNGFDENKYAPENDERFAIGCDPVNSGSEAVHGQSKAAAAVFRKYDMNHRENRSDTFIADYVFDPDDPSDFYEDMIIACHFFGCKIHIENQKFDIYNHFKRRGYKQFIMTRPENTTMDIKKKIEGTLGTSASSSIIDLYITRLKTHIAKRGHALRGKRMIQDFLKFTYDTRGQRDLTVAAGFAILAAEAPYEPKADPTPIHKMWGYFK